MTEIKVTTLLLFLIRGVMASIKATSIAPYDSSSTDIPSSFSGAVSHGYAESHGLYTSYYEYGNSSNPTVIMTGGWPSGASALSGFAEGLAHAGAHVVLYDTIGSGSSSHPWGSWDYSITNLADEMAAVIEAAAPNKKVATFGEAWTPFISSEYCAMHPDDGAIDTIFSIGIPCFDLSNQALIDQTKNLVNDQQNLTRVISQWASLAYMGLISFPAVPEALIDSGIPQYIVNELNDVFTALNTSDSQVLSSILGESLADGLLESLKYDKSDTSHGMQKYEWYVQNRLVPGILSGKMYRQYLPVDRLKVWMLKDDNIETNIMLEGLGEHTSAEPNITYLDSGHFGWGAHGNSKLMRSTIIEWIGA